MSDKPKAWHAEEMLEHMPTDAVTCPCGVVCKLDNSATMGKWDEDGPTVEYRSVGWKCPKCGGMIFTREQADQRTINLLRATVEWLQKDREPLNDLVNALLTRKYIQTLPKTRSILVDGQPFIVEATQTASTILALVSKDFQYQLFLENATPRGQDTLITGIQAIAMLDGMEFYTVPHATY